MQPFPFLRTDLQRGFEEMKPHLPPWLKEVSQITMKVYHSLWWPADFELIPGPLYEARIWNPETNTYDIEYVEQIFFPVPKIASTALNQPVEVNPIDSEENQEGAQLSAAGVARVEVELGDVQKIQNVAAVILKIQASLKVTFPCLEKAICERSYKGRLNQKIKSLKKKLLNILARIDSELLEFSTQNDPLFAWSTWNGLVEEKKAIEKLLRKVSSDSIRQHLQLNMGQSKQEILADIIGLQPELASIIFEESDHESEEDQIHRYFDTVHRNCLQDEVRQTDKKYLFNLGFSHNRAQYIAEKIGPNKERHISTLDFAHIFIENLFKYDLLLTDELTLLPDTSQQEKVVYTVQRSANGDGSTTTIHCCNFSQSNQTEKDVEEFLTTATDESEPAKSDAEEFSFWFHGTDAKFATDIVNNGIDIQKGRQRKDFSDGNGFYLSNHHPKAVEWGKRMSLVNGCCAVLRYKIAKKTLEAPDGIILSDQSPDIERWREIVRFNRSGKTVGDQKLKNLLRKTRFIIGPLSQDGNWNSKTAADANWPKLLSNNWRQLCICDADLADGLNLVLDKVAFIQKTENRRVAQYL